MKSQLRKKKHFGTLFGTLCYLRARAKCCGVVFVSTSILPKVNFLLNLYMKEMKKHFKHEKSITDTFVSHKQNGFHLI